MHHVQPPVVERLVDQSCDEGIGGIFGDERSRSRVECGEMVGEIAGVIVERPAVDAVVGHTRVFIQTFGMPVVAPDRTALDAEL